MDFARLARQDPNESIPASGLPARSRLPIGLARPTAHAPRLRPFRLRPYAERAIPGEAVTVSRGRFRIYSEPPGQPRARRATDILLLLGALAGLILLTVAYPPSGFERSFETFLDNVPGWLDPVWGFLYDLLWLWAMVIALAAVVSRRWVIAIQALGSLVLVVVVAWIVSRYALGHWPDLGTAIEGASDSPKFPAMRVAETAAVILVVSPHLVKAFRRTGHWILFLGIVGGILTDTSTAGAISPHSWPP